MTRTPSTRQLSAVLLAASVSAGLAACASPTPSDAQNSRDLASSVASPAGESGDLSPSQSGDADASPSGELGPALEFAPIPEVQNPSEDAARELFALLETSLNQAETTGVIEKGTQSCFDPKSESGERTSSVTGIYNPSATGKWKAVYYGNHEAIVFPAPSSDAGYDGSLNFYQQFTADPENPEIVVEKIGEESWVIGLKGAPTSEYWEEAFPVRVDAAEGLVAAMWDTRPAEWDDIMVGLEGRCPSVTHMDYAPSAKDLELVNALNAAAVAAFQPDGSPTAVQVPRIEAFVKGTVEGWKRACEDVSALNSPPTDFSLEKCLNDPGRYSASPGDLAFDKERAPVMGTPEQVYEYALGKGWHRVVGNLPDLAVRANLDPPYLLSSLAGPHPDTFRLLQGIPS